MTEKQAKRIFKKFNNASDVIRCPNGKANTKKLLHSYARAAVNLYGIISCNELLDIFNEQNNEHIEYKDIYTFLLPLVLKEGWYCFYKHYIVHYSFFTDFEQADYLLEIQSEKPRYIPDRSTFLQYADEYYTDNDNLLNIYLYISDHFGRTKHIYQIFNEIEEYIMYSNDIGGLTDILQKIDFMVDDEKQIQDFINMITDAKNNTRIWENKGYTPIELCDIMKEQNKKIIKFPVYEKRKIERNELCPCGSGKKYKNCCSVFEDKKEAQLSSEECREFYEMWYGLLSFVNDKKNILNIRITTDYPNNINDVKLHKVREVLWSNPELIEEYIKKVALTKEKIDILKLWKTNHIKGMFFVLEYKPEYAVAITSNENGEDRLYGIKGISNPISNILQRNLPIQIETVLLPFKGKIIYDTYIVTFQIKYLEGVKKFFKEIYDKAIEYGIITCLE